MPPARPRGYRRAAATPPLRPPGRGRVPPPRPRPAPARRESRRANSMTRIARPRRWHDRQRSSSPPDRPAVAPKSALRFPGRSPPPADRAGRAGRRRWSAHSAPRLGARSAPTSAGGTRRVAVARANAEIRVVLERQAVHGSNRVLRGGREVLGGLLSESRRAPECNGQRHERYKTDEQVHPNRFSTSYSEF